MTPAEWKRKAVHAGMGLFALALRYLDWRVAALCAGAALAFNVFAMPKIGRAIYRSSVPKRDTGIVAYPAMVLLLILIFGDSDLPLVAAVWAMMAFGDPAATIAGRLVGGPALPWNGGKTWVGLLADWAVAGSTSVAVFSFVVRQPPRPEAVLILMLGAGLYAFLESVRSGLDDNVVAALPTALAVYAMGTRGAPAWIASASVRTLLIALAVNAAVALLIGALRVVSVSGAVAGAVAGFLILVAGGWGAYGLLWTFFVAGTLATKLGYRRKATAGLAQGNAGRRGAANVAANCLVPAVLLLLGVPAIAYVAAFGAALADTLGTEVGTLYGRRAFSPLGFRALPAGTPGAISWPGTAASLAGAALVAAAGWGLGLVPAALVLAAVLGGFLGALSESVVNDFGRRNGFSLDHEFANALNTFLGAMLALRIGRA